MSRFGGMTVNERLYEASLMDNFDDAVRKGDRARMIDILESVEVTGVEAVRTADAILANPTRYGRLP